MSIWFYDGVSKMLLESWVNTNVRAYRKLPVMLEHTTTADL